jgi:hypothetical protein
MDRKKRPFLSTFSPAIDPKKTAIFALPEVQEAA